MTYNIKTHFPVVISSHSEKFGSTCLTIQIQCLSLIFTTIPIKLASWDFSSHVIPNDPKTCQQFSLKPLCTGEHSLKTCSQEGLRVSETTL